jgi:hypothetical protein
MSTYLSTQYCKIYNGNQISTWLDHNKLSVVEKLNNGYRDYASGYLDPTYCGIYDLYQPPNQNPKPLTPILY